MSEDFFLFLKGEIFPLYEWNLFYIRIHRKKKSMDIQLCFQNICALSWIYSSFIKLQLDEWFLSDQSKFDSISRQMEKPFSFNYRLWVHFYSKFIRLHKKFIHKKQIHQKFFTIGEFDVHWMNLMSIGWICFASEWICF